MPERERGDGLEEVLFGADTWRVDPEKGTLSLTEEALASVLNKDPLDQWYDIDNEPIARGQFAVVYHCTHRHSGLPYAAKFASKARIVGDATATIQHEIAINVLLNPSLINVKLREVFETEDDFILIMEFAEGGDLQSVLDADIVPFETYVVNFLKQVLKALVHMHSRNIAHLDIKPQNLVMMGEFPDCEVKLVDFEISRYIDPERDIVDFLGTPDYVAPEILCLDPITTKTDMWSVGVLSYVLLSGFLPFDGTSDQQTFIEILRAEITFPEPLFGDVSDDAIDFIEKLLIREPENRMSAQECLEHRWMTKIFTNSNDQVKPLTTSPPLPIMRAESSPSVIGMIKLQTDDDNYSARSHSIGETTAINKPPHHPKTSHKSLSVASELGVVKPTVAQPLPGITHFLNKESRMGSRQNLDRLKSMSKSREVLHEKIQMSNVKKSLSKSRERLYAPQTVTDSQQDFHGCKVLSQSIEAISALNKLHRSDIIHRSCNNLLKPHPRLAKMKERMYMSMVSIDNIMKSESDTRNNYSPSKCDVDDQFNDLVTLRNTNLNTVTMDYNNQDLSYVSNATKLGGSRANPCRGGRTADAGDDREPSYKPTEPTRKVSRPNKADRMKKDAQQRRKERKERDIRDEVKHRKYSLGYYEAKTSSPDTKQNGTTSPKMRRGSVCHVEQRLQERHERQGQFRRLVNSEARGRLSSTDSERSTIENSSNKPRNKPTTSDKPRNVLTRERRRSSKLESLKNSDTSSMESVIGSSENIQKSNSCKEVVNDRKIVKRARRIGQHNVNNNMAHKNIEDIAEVSDENSQTVAENSTVDEVNPMIRERDEESLMANKENVMPRIINIISKEIPSIQIDGNDKFVDEDVLPNNEDEETRISKCVVSSQDSLDSLIEEKTNLSRTLSNTSDLGSSLSESTADDERLEDYKPTKCRCRSLSVQQKSIPKICIDNARSRSKSVVQQEQENEPKPWGEICNGSIAKALRNFTLQEEPINFDVKT